MKGSEDGEGQEFSSRDTEDERKRERRKKKE